MLTPTLQAPAEADVRGDARAFGAALKSSPEVLMNHLRAANAVKAYLPTVAGDVSGELRLAAGRPSVQATAALSALPTSSMKGLLR